MQGLLGIADQTDFHGITQADAHGIEVDLNAAGLTRLGHERDVREGTASNQNAVAIFHRVLGWLGSQQADGAGCVRAVIRNYGFSQESFYEGCADFFGHLLQLNAGLQGSAAGQNHGSFPGVEHCSGMFEIHDGMRALSAENSDTWFGMLHRLRPFPLRFTSSS